MDWIEWFTTHCMGHPPQWFTQPIFYLWTDKTIPYDINGIMMAIISISEHLANFPRWRAHRQRDLTRYVKALLTFPLNKASSSHMMFPVLPPAANAVTTFCKLLYSDKLTISSFKFSFWGIFYSWRTIFSNKVFLSFNLIWKSSFCHGACICLDWRGFTPHCVLFPRSAYMSL